MTLGLNSGQVAFATSHEAWAEEYQRERANLLAAIGPQILKIEHVGSTSIKSVPAKPIIDIMVGVRNFDEARVCVEPMVGIGYEYRGEYGIPQRHYFVKGNPRTHHLHMVELQSDQWRTTLHFRDLLRTNPTLAQAYAEEKVRLAARYASDRTAYQEEKGRLIDRIVRQAC